MSSKKKLSIEEIKEGFKKFNFPYEHYRRDGMSAWTFCTTGDGIETRSIRISTGDGGAQMMLEALQESIRPKNIKKLLKKLKDGQ